MECAATGIACAQFYDTISAWRAQRKAEIEAEEKKAAEPAGRPSSEADPVPHGHSTGPTPGGAMGTGGTIWIHAPLPMVIITDKE